MEIGNRTSKDSVKEAQKMAAMPASGQYMARCYAVWNIGTQDEMSAIAGPTEKLKVLIWFELYGVPLFTFDEKKGPQSWSAKLEERLSNAPKANLTKILKAWYNSDPTVVEKIEKGTFVLNDILGRMAQLGIVKKARKSDPEVFDLKIETIIYPMPGTEGMFPQQMYNHPSLFDVDIFDVNNPQYMESFFALPYYYQDKVLKSHELRGRMNMETIKRMYPHKFGQGQQNAPVQQPPQQFQQAPVQFQQAPQQFQQAPQYQAPVQTPPVQAPQFIPPVQPPIQPPVQPQKIMTAKAQGATYEAFIANGWNDKQLIENGYMVVNNPAPIPQTFGNQQMNFSHTGNPDDMPF